MCRQSVENYLNATNIPTRKSTVFGGSGGAAVQLLLKALHAARSFCAARLLGLNSPDGIITWTDRYGKIILSYGHKFCLPAGEVVERHLAAFFQSFDE
jgi:hypothetical protein